MPVMRRTDGAQLAHQRFAAADAVQQVQQRPPCRIPSGVKEGGAGESSGWVTAAAATAAAAEGVKLQAAAISTAAGCDAFLRT